MFSQLSVTINIMESVKAVVQAILNSTEDDIQVELSIQNSTSTIQIRKRVEHFVGYKPKLVLSVAYVERVKSETVGYHTPEYFDVSEIDTAIDTAILRTAAAPFYTAGLGRPFIHVFEAEKEETE